MPDGCLVQPGKPAPERTCRHRHAQAGSGQAHTGSAPDTTRAVAGSSTDPQTGDTQMVPAIASNMPGGAGPRAASSAFVPEEEDE